MSISTGVLLVMGAENQKGLMCSMTVQNAFALIQDAAGLEPPMDKNCSETCQQIEPARSCFDCMRNTLPFCFTWMCADQQSISKTTMRQMVEFSMRLS